MSKPTWIPEAPPNAATLDEAIRSAATGNTRAGVTAVRLRKSDAAWFVEGARTGEPNPSSPGPAVDLRHAVTDALRRAGETVVGMDALGEPLSPDREAAIRSAVRKALEGLPTPDEALFDVQVVADVLAEVDRLRAKLRLASHAGALTEQAAAKLRDASVDITPRPTRFRKA